jgi:hypothetical protein
VTRLDSRIAAMEARLRPRPKVLRGTFELHYTEAWPGCLGFPDVNCQQCTEHGPNCAALVTPTSEPGRRLIVITGSVGPRIGLD